MSKHNRKAKQMAFLAAELAEKNPRKWGFQATPRKFGFICKPLNPYWVKALERKVRIYKDRMDRCGFDVVTHCWVVNGDYFDRQSTLCKIQLIEEILEKGEVSLAEFRLRVASFLGISEFEFQRKVALIVARYCEQGGCGITSPGGFLPSDENYDSSFV